jgi:hypothetical protein
VSQNAPGLVPEEIRQALDGRPDTGAWDPMFPLLTVDEAGYPHVCLLSRTELTTHQDRVLAVVASRHTIENLHRDGLATLLVVSTDGALYLKMHAEHTVEAEPGVLGVSFEVRSVKRDGVGVPLEPARFLVTAGLEAAEDWYLSRQVLDQLRRTGPAT